MIAYQVAGNAYQGAGQLAYQTAGGGLFGEPQAIHHVGAPSGRVGAAVSEASERIGGPGPVGGGRIGS